MAKSIKTGSWSSPKGSVLKVGLAESASISRVEGLVMSKDMARMFQGFEKSGKSHEARRATLKSKYGKASG